MLTLEKIITTMVEFRDSEWVATCLSDGAPRKESAMELLAYLLYKNRASFNEFSESGGYRIITNGYDSLKYVESLCGSVRLPAMEVLNKIIKLEGK